MEIYFKYYVNFKQNNWVSLMPITQLAYNNKKSNTTKLIPLFANYGNHPEFLNAPKPKPNIQKIMVTISDITKLHDKKTNAVIHNNNKIETINQKKGISIEKGE